MHEHIQMHSCFIPFYLNETDTEELKELDLDLILFFEIVFKVFDAFKIKVFQRIQKHFNDTKELAKNWSGSDPFFLN